MNPFQDILITSSGQLSAEFTAQLGQLRQAILQATWFAPGSPESLKLAQVLRDITFEGDAALAAYTEKFDNVRLTPDQFRIQPEELKAAHAGIDADLMKSLRSAIENVRRYQSEIFIGNKNTHPGIKYTPIGRVGVCVPGASAPLPSTVIMTAVPAQVAGVDQIAVVSPPRHNGSIHPVILAVCQEIGIEEVYRVGGSQAVMALAKGTKTIQKVDKIVGPGNQWVQMAKREVFGLVDIDSIAGPSEVLIIADDSANPAWVAADMLSQAEHDPGSAVVLTTSENLAKKVLDELAVQVNQLQRSEGTTRCLQQFSKIVVFDDMSDVISWANILASEHLQIQCGDKSREVADQIRNAGAIFIGDYTPVAVGDYWAGPSHTLPTGMSAKFFSALSSNDFIKSTSIIEYSRDQLSSSGEDIVRLAETEGLDAHARSVSIRKPS